ncbi:MAG: zinc ribbon domain-containing protein, partial [bacterium]
MILVDKYEVTTKLCSNYGAKKENIKLSYRTYRCDNCGLVIDRDLNSA